MRMIWTVFVCLITPLVAMNHPAPSTECVMKHSTRICFGSEAIAGDLDWFVETSDESGRIRRYTERLPYDQEVRRVAVSIDSGWIIHIVHSRWLDEFSTRLETRWELVLFDANGSIKNRLDLPGKPDGWFDLAGFLFVLFPNGDVRTFDRTLTGRLGLPPVLELTLHEALAIPKSAVWRTPDGEPDEFSGIGRYRLEWFDQEVRLDLDVIVVASIEGVADDAIYPDRVSYVSDTPLSVDGATPSMSGTIDTPGYHQLAVFGENGYRLEWTILIKPKLFGLPSALTTETVRLYSNAIMILNGNPYVPGTPIAQAGEYELTLSGTGDYHESHSFIIASSANGVSNDGVYEAPWTFHVNGTGLLNGETVSGEITIRTAGDYELAFWDDPSAPRFVRFQIVAAASKTPSGDPSGILQIGLAVLAVLGLYFIQKRK